jgi:hypothetical protein
MLIVIGLGLLIIHSYFLKMPPYNRPMIWNQTFFRLIVMLIGYFFVFIGALTLIFN